MRKLSIILLSIIIATIISVSVLTRPDKVLNLSFWLNIGWLFLLIGINWSVFTYAFISTSEGSKSSIFGALPSIGFVVFIYSIGSSTVLFISWIINGFDNHSSWHLVTQILMFSSAAIISVVILMAAKSSDNSQPEGLISKEQISNILTNLNMGIAIDHVELKKELKELNEIIKYSMPHLTKLSSPEKYIKLQEEISKLNSGIEINDELIEHVRSLKVLALSC